VVIMGARRTDWRWPLLFAVFVELVFPFIHAARFSAALRRDLMVQHILALQPHAMPAGVNSVVRLLDLSPGPMAVGGAILPVFLFGFVAAVCAMVTRYDFGDPSAWPIAERLTFSALVVAARGALLALAYCLAAILRSAPQYSWQSSGQQLLALPVVTGFLGIFTRSVNEPLVIAVVAAALIVSPGSTGTSRSGPWRSVVPIVGLSMLPGILLVLWAVRHG
jgi:hypothetical protein